jgi:hypothetical protein
LAENKHMLYGILVIVAFVAVVAVVVILMSTSNIGGKASAIGVNKLYERENPCQNNRCDPSIDCKCTTPQYGDCNWRVCPSNPLDEHEDACQNNRCDPTIDCKCTTPKYGDCNWQQCPTPTPN